MTHTLNDPIKVLVVDDDDRFRSNSIRLLQARGFQAGGASDGTTCLTMLAQGGYDVVVLDQSMPGLSGVETLRAIREYKLAAEVIFLTGHACVTDTVTGEALGDVDYLLKPATTEQLTEKILSAYERKMKREGKAR